jgi:hypothetical protein
MSQPQVKSISDHSRITVINNFSRFAANACPSRTCGIGCRVKCVIAHFPGSGVFGGFHLGTTGRDLARLCSAPVAVRAFGGTKHRTIHRLRTRSSLLHFRSSLLPVGRSGLPLELFSPDCPALVHGCQRSGQQRHLMTSADLFASAASCYLAMAFVRGQRFASGCTDWHRRCDSAGAVGSFPVGFSFPQGGFLVTSELGYRGFFREW